MDFEDEEDYELDNNAAMDESVVDVARGPGYAHVNMDGRGPNSLISDQQPLTPHTGRQDMFSFPLDPDAGRGEHITSYTKDERIWMLRKIAKLTNQQKTEIKTLLNKILETLDDDEEAKGIEPDNIGSYQERVTQSPEPKDVGSYQAGAYDNYEGTLNNGIGGSPPGSGGGGWGGVVDTGGYNQL